MIVKQKIVKQAAHQKVQQMSKKLICSFVVVMAMLVCLVGCGNAAGEEAVDATAKADSNVITDMAGRTVELPKNVEKIATFGSIGVLNAFVECMGAGDKICNDMSPSFKKSPRWQYQYKFVPTLGDHPQFQDESKEILIEKVLEVKPDVCLVMNKAEVDLLEKQGLNVVYLSWENIDDVKECVTILGDILNDPARAKDYIKYFDEKVELASSLTKGIKEEDKKTVLYGDVVTYVQPHLIAEWWIKQAGGISVTDNGRTENTFKYSLEDLLKWNPDVMILSTKATAEEILADKRLANVNAVKTKQIFTGPTVAHVWGNRTVEQPLTIMWAMNKMYPEIMTYDMLKQEIYYFYDHFYGYQMTDDEIAKIVK